MATWGYLMIGSLKVIFYELYLSITRRKQLILRSLNYILINKYQIRTTQIIRIYNSNILLFPWC